MIPVMQLFISALISADLRQSDAWESLQPNKRLLESGWSG